MNAASDSGEMLDISQVFGREDLSALDWRASGANRVRFLIATVELQKKGQVAANTSLIKFVTATKKVFLLKRRFADFHFTNVRPCGTKCGKT